MEDAAKDGASLHAAGHAVAAVVFGVSVNRVLIDKYEDGRGWGGTIEVVGDMDLVTELTVALAGPAAEVHATGKSPLSEIDHRAGWADDRSAIRLAFLARNQRPPAVGEFSRHSEVIRGATLAAEIVALHWSAVAIVAKKLARGQVLRGAEVERFVRRGQRAASAAAVAPRSQQHSAAGHQVTNRERTRST